MCVELQVEPRATVAGATVAGWDARPLALGAIDASLGADGDLRFQPQRPWRFELTCRLAAPLQERLWDVPGVRLKGGNYPTRIEVPYDAGAIVHTMLDEAKAVEGKHYTITGGWVGAATEADRYALALSILSRSEELRPEVFGRLARDFQRDTALQAAAWGSAQVWIDPGGGKTLVGHLFAFTAPGPVVLITRGAARFHHEREVTKWTTLRPYVCLPKAQTTQRKGTLRDYLHWCANKNQRPFVIVGWEALPLWTFRGGKADGPLVRLLRDFGGTLIADESHKMKSHVRGQQSVGRDGRRETHDLLNVSSAAAHLAQAAARRLLTTATPIYDRLSDLWAQCDVCHPGTMGGFWRYAQHYCGARKGEHGWLTDAPTHFKLLPHTGELQQRLRHSVIRVPYSVSHGSLPPKRRYIEFLGPDDVRKPDGGFARDMKAAVKAHDRNRLTELKLEEAASMKRPWIVDKTKQYRDIRDRHGKIVIMAGRVQEADALVVALRSLFGCGPNHDPRGLEAGSTPWVWVAHGGNEGSSWGTDSAYRQRMADAFMKHPGPCALVGGDEAVGESIDLNDADAEIIGKIPFSPGKVRQLEGRVYRLSQTRPVDIFYPLVEGTYDMACNAILVGKLPAVEEVGQDEELRGMTVQAEGLGATWEDEERLMDALEQALAAEEPGAD